MNPKNDIAPGSFERCVVRAISTARLALGYETGLPYPVKDGAQYPRELCSLMADSFPDRQIIMLADQVFWTILAKEGWSLPDNITFWTKINPDWKAPIPCALEDKYLWIFGYHFLGTKGHIVIGCPIKGDTDLYIYVIFGIEL